ncbi:hypothetical protein ACN47E_001859 [Coniothyrium glycines]
MVKAQHLAIRVSDIERSTQFYLKTFNAKLAAKTYTSPKELAEAFFGVKNTEYKIALIELADGFGLELFQFVPDVHPTIGVPQETGGYMHFAIAVDDVEATVERGVASGGTGGAIAGFAPNDPTKFTYLRDPDGNYIELNDTTWDKLMGAIVTLFPEAAL